MSRIGTKKPPIKNAYYAPQEHVPSMHANGKATNQGYFSASNKVTEQFKSSSIEKE